MSSQLPIFKIANVGLAPVRPVPSNFMSRKSAPPPPSRQAPKSTAFRRLIQIGTDVAVIVVLFVIYGIVCTYVSPTIVYFTCDQSDLSYPYVTETLPFYVVCIYSTCAPILMFILVETYNARLLPYQKNIKRLSMSERLRRLLVVLFHTVSLFALGIAITLLLTEIGKRCLGRLRPHFISVCKNNVLSALCTAPAQTGALYNSLYTGGSFCTGDSAKINNARLSFPSDHASYSTFCMLFLIIYVDVRLVLLRVRYLKVIIQISAFIVAFITDMNKITDYYSRASDVIGGSLLGALIALFVTFVVGQVLWIYDVEEEFYEFDLKPRR